MPWNSSFCKPSMPPLKICCRPYANPAISSMYVTQPHAACSFFAQPSPPRQITPASSSRTTNRYLSAPTVSLCKRFVKSPESRRDVCFANALAESNPNCASLPLGVHPRQSTADSGHGLLPRWSTLQRTGESSSGLLGLHACMRLCKFVS